MTSKRRTPSRGGSSQSFARRHPHQARLYRWVGRSAVTLGKRGCKWCWSAIDVTLAESIYRVRSSTTRTARQLGSRYGDRREARRELGKAGARTAVWWNGRPYSLAEAGRLLDELDHQPWPLDTKVWFPGEPKAPGPPKTGPTRVVDPRKTPRTGPKVRPAPKTYGGFAVNDPRIFADLANPQIDQANWQEEVPAQLDGARKLAEDAANHIATMHDWYRSGQAVPELLAAIEEAQNAQAVVAEAFAKGVKAAEQWASSARVPNFAKAG